MWLGFEVLYLSPTGLDFCCCLPGGGLLCCPSELGRLWEGSFKRATRLRQISTTTFSGFTASTSRVTCELPLFDGVSAVP